MSDDDSATREPTTESPTEPGLDAEATHNTGVPSATVPGAQVEPHGGHESSTERSDSTYVDGNLDQRGVTATGPRQSEIAEGSLDEAAGADTSPRTDGRGRGDQH